MSNKIAIISDIHIGCHQNSTQWHDIILNYFKYFNQYLDKNNIDHVFVLGDIFDDRTEISVTSINNCYNIFNQLKGKNIYLITGNHDQFYKDKADIHSLVMFKNWNNYKVYNCEDNIKLNERNIGIIPWNCICTNKYDVILGHLEINGFKLNSAKVCTDGIDYNELFKYSNLIFSGHFHLNSEKVFDKGKIIYTGAPYEITWGDINVRKGFYILNLDDLSYEFVENNISPRHITYILSECLDNKDKMVEMKENFKNNIIKFIIDRDISKDQHNILVGKMDSWGSLSFSVDFLDKNLKILDRNIELNKDNINNINIWDSIVEFVDKLDIKGNKSNILNRLHLLYEKNQ